MKNLALILIALLFCGCAPFRADYHTVSSWKDCDKLAQREGWEFLFRTNRIGHIPLIEPSGADVVCYAENERECVTTNTSKCYTKKVANNLYETTCTDKDTTCTQKVNLYKKIK